MTRHEQGAGFEPDPPDDRLGHDADRGESYTGDETERALEQIRHWETSTRLVADDPTMTLRGKCLALLEMAFRARRSELAAFLERAVWNGCRHLFEEEVEIPRDLINAIRRLRHQGHERCPECRRDLPSHKELDRWRELSHDYRRPA